VSGGDSGPRRSQQRRETKETTVEVDLDVDGSGGPAPNGIPFLDHMLDQLGRHGGLD